jgi:hypothetical protein
LRPTRFSLLELLLAVPFVAAFVALIVTGWEGAGSLRVQAVVSACIVLPLSYLVFVLMVRQYREQRQRWLKVKASRPARDDEYFGGRWDG